MTHRVVQNDVAYWRPAKQVPTLLVQRDRAFAHTTLGVREFKEGKGHSERIIKKKEEQRIRLLLGSPISFLDLP